MRRVIRAADVFYWQSGISDDVPALTYYLLISLAPFLLALTAMAAMLSGASDLAFGLADDITAEFPSDASAVLLSLMRRTHADSPTLLILGLLVALWTCSGGVGVVERCLSRLLDRPRRSAVANKIKHLGLAAALLVGIVSLLAMAAAASGLLARSGVTVPGDRLPLLLIAAVLFSSLTLLFWLAPTGRMQLSAAACGAAPATVALLLVPVACDLYIQTAAGASLHQVFFVMLVFIAAAWLAAQTILIGAGIAAAKQLRAERR